MLKVLHKVKKLPMTLLEVMIAMALTMLLLSSLSYMFLFVEKINQRSEAKQEQAFSTLYLEERLNYLMRHTYSPRDVDKHYYFFTSQAQDSSLFKEGTPSLTFSFNNGNVLDKSFGGAVLGRLFVDPKGDLTLAVWPLPTEVKKLPETIHKEILLKGVEEMNFYFLVAPSKDRTRIFSQLKKGMLAKKTFKQLPPAGFNHRQWQSDYSSLPAAVKIEIKQNNEWLHFSIPLPHSDQVILYEGGE